MVTLMDTVNQGICVCNQCPFMTNDQFLDRLPRLATSYEAQKQPSPPLVHGRL